MVAVIIAAWHASRWIRQCLASVQAQRYAPGVDIRIGVDACEATAQTLRAAGVPYFWSPRRVGPYLLRNSLIAGCGPDVTHYQVYDADDVMRQGFLARMVAAAGEHGVAGCAAWNWSGVGPVPSRVRHLRVTPFYGCAMTISRGAWAQLGGFRSWRVAADSDVLLRAAALGVRVSVIDEPLHVRRRHPTSQTRCESTGGGSALRRELWAAAQAQVSAGDLVVVPETVALRAVA